MNTKQMSLITINKPIFLPEDEVWYEINIKTSLRSQLNPINVLRALSNSKQSVGRKNNREWWNKNVRSGFYLNQFNANGLRITLYLNLRNELHELDFHARVKKVCGLGSVIEIARLNQIYLPKEIITLHPIKGGFENIIELANQGQENLKDEEKLVV
jgi:hypothetical protein